MPPVDAIQTVSYVKAYFNSSDPARQTVYQQQCKDLKATGAVCEVPELSGAPDPAGPFGETFFFTAQSNMTNGQINHELPYYSG